MHAPSLDPAATDAHAEVSAPRPLRLGACRPSPVARRPPARLQDLKAHLGAVSQQLHSLDERLRFMEGAMAGGGRKRSWLPLFG